MAEGLTEIAASKPRQQRVIGELVGERPGPVVLVLCGIHGNEPTGVIAAGRVLESVRKTEKESGLPLCGRVLFLAGNLQALSQSVRYVDVDLNRAWTEEKVAKIDRDEPSALALQESSEQKELLAIFRRVTEGVSDEVYFFDLHTSSADGAPFSTVGDTLRNREFAQGFPIPLILGLEEQVDGALLEFLNNRGLITMGIEAGRHDCMKSADRHEAFLWLALERVGIFGSQEEGHSPFSQKLKVSRELLKEASRGIPRIVEVRRRHAITESDQFRMDSGFTNFQPVQKEQRLAEDKNGPVVAREKGLILLPLYQGQGDDGFFLAREVRGFWLWLSSLLRRCRIGGLLKFLPGVRRGPNDPQLLVVDTRVARYYPLEIFHLFGFRKRRRHGHVLLVSRRQNDLKRPERIEI